MTTKPTPKSIKNRNRAKVIGTICRMLNLLEEVGKPYDPEDVPRLYKLLTDTAYSLHSQGVPMKYLNAEMQNAGWDYSVFEWCNYNSEFFIGERA